MKTSELQSILARQASVITFWHHEAKEARLLAREQKQHNQKDKASQNYGLAENYIKSIKKMAVIQRSLKDELRGSVPKVLN